MADNSELKKIDFLFSREVESFEHKIEIDGPWTINKFHVKSDTIYYSENSNFTKIYQGKFKVYKSTFTQHYHLVMKTP